MSIKQFLKRKLASVNQDNRKPEYSRSIQVSDTAVSDPAQYSHQLTAILNSLKAGSKEKDALLSLINIDLSASYDDSTLSEYLKLGTTGLEKDPVFSWAPIPAGDRFSDGTICWLYLKEEENLCPALLSILCQKPLHVHLRLPDGMDLPEHIKTCLPLLRHIHPIRVISLISECEGQRFYRDLLTGTCYKDYVEEGYGAVDDAETVWFRFQEEVSPDAVPPSKQES